MFGYYSIRFDMKKHRRVLLRCCLMVSAGLPGHAPGAAGDPAAVDRGGPALPEAAPRRGPDLSGAAADVTLDQPVELLEDEVWDTGTRTIFTTPAALLSGPGTLTKKGAGTLVLSAANTFSAPLRVEAGRLTIKHAQGAGTHLNAVTGAGLGMVWLADGTTFRYERTSGQATIFPEVFLEVGPASTAYLTTDLAGNGFGGPVGGGADSILQIGQPGAWTQCSFSAGRVQQFANFKGTVRVPPHASLRFSATGGMTNGGAATLFEIDGNLTTRNGGTVTMGALRGAATGTITGAMTTGTVTYSTGFANLDSTYAGVINDRGTSLIHFTKTGTATQVLTGNSRYAGVTTIAGGVLQLGDGGTTGAIGTGPVNFTDAAAVLRIRRGGSMEIAGSITGAGTLEKRGSGTLVLRGSNPLFSGPVMIHEGVIALGNPTGSTTGTGPVTVTGTGMLAGPGRAGGAVTAGQGGVIAPGQGGSGDLTVGSLTLSEGAELRIGVTPEKSPDRVNVTRPGGLVIHGGGVRLCAAGTERPWAVPGTWALMACAGEPVGHPSLLKVLNPVPGFGYRFGMSGGLLTLTITGDGVGTGFRPD